MHNLLKRWFNRHLQGIDHAEVMSAVIADGSLSPAFLFLTVVSCGIATLGLLLNSTAVIIGAMLVAPLMGPIILGGFAIARLEPLLAGRALLALLVGMVTALLLAMLIVRLSPYIPPTAEILARTQPNLFDLLVAILSGCAGGYAVIRRQGGVVVGVAIATALMPPLATVGYGLATADGVIAQGAAFLFLTNLLAIALAVTVTASWYGFGRLRAAHGMWWPTLVAGAVLAVLCIPLAQRLNQSVQEAWQSKRIEQWVRADPLLVTGKIAQIDISTPATGIQVDLVVIARQFDPAAEGRLQQALQRGLDKPVTLRLDQVISARPYLPKASPRVTPDSALSALPFGIQRINVDPQRKSATAFAQSGELSTMMEQERLLQARFKDWDLRIIPPPQPLAIRFAHRSASLDDTARGQLEAMAWCLQRWGVKTVTAEGWEAVDETQNRTKPWAGLRAAGVATWLSHHQFGVEALHRTPDAAQRADEKEVGAATYRVVLLRVADHPHALPAATTPK